MIREDREFLAELARLSTAMPSLAQQIMDGTASPTDRENYAQRLIVACEQLLQRVNANSGTVIEGQVLATRALALPVRTVEQRQEV